MYIRRQGTLFEGDLSKADTLTLELCASDAEKLKDPDQRMSMDRFASFKHRCYGWGPMDKVFVRLEDQQEDYPSVLANVALDPGGDLFFTVFNTPELADLQPGHLFDDITDVVANPTDVARLAQVHVEHIRIDGLPYLWNHLHAPTFKLPDQLH